MQKKFDEDANFKKTAQLKTVDLQKVILTQEKLGNLFAKFQEKTLKKFIKN